MQCQYCQSSDTEWMNRTRPDLVRNGNAPDGSPYTSIRWNRRKCRSCERIFVHKMYVNS